MRRAALSSSSVVAERSSSWLQADAGDLAIAVVGQPRLQQVVIELGVELQRERPAEHERLRRVRGPGDFRGSGRQCPACRNAIGTRGRRVSGSRRRSSRRTSRSPGSPTGRPTRRTPEPAADRRSTRRGSARPHPRHRASSASRRRPRSGAAPRHTPATGRRAGRSRRRRSGRETSPRLPASCTRSAGTTSNVATS